MGHSNRTLQVAGALGDGRAEASWSSWQEEGWVLFALKLVPNPGQELSMHEKEGIQGPSEVCQPPCWSTAPKGSGV